MFSKNFFKKKIKDPEVTSWLKKQGDLEDALIYLVEKELYEHGQRDLSYVIPRRRNTAYFDTLFQNKKSVVKHQTNIDFYDSVTTLRPKSPSSPQPINPPLTTKKEGRVMTQPHKRKKIYNTTSSAVVITPPETVYTKKKSDMTCFED